MLNTGNMKKIMKNVLITTKKTNVTRTTVMDTLIYKAIKRVGDKRR